MTGWKKKLTSDQLEKKRLLDRTNQRKSRVDSRRTQEELRKRFAELLEQDDCNLLQRLVAENNRLRDIYEHCQSKIENLVHWSQDCLDFTQDPVLNYPPVRPAPFSSRESQRSRNTSKDGSPAESVEPAPGSDQRNNGKSISGRVFAKSQASIIFQLALILQHQRAGSTTECSINDLIESIMTWKMAHGQGMGFEFLLSHFGADKEPLCITVEKVQSATALPTFYQSLLHCIYNDGALPHAESLDYVRESLAGQPVMTQQRRAISYLAYEVLRPYRDFFKGTPEFISQFWCMYTYFTFLTFPTEENLKKSPLWMWPTKPQFENEHPGSVDFLCWPSLREDLAKTWRRYQIEDMMPFMVQNFELTDFPGKYGPGQIRLKPGNMDLELDQRFQDGIFNLDNYIMHKPFRDKYPELEKHFNVMDPSRIFCHATSFDFGTPTGAGATAARVGDVQQTLNQAGQSNEADPTGSRDLNALNFDFSACPDWALDTPGPLLAESQDIHDLMPKTTSMAPASTSQWFTEPLNWGFEGDFFAADIASTDPVFIDNSRAHMVPD